MLEKNTVSRPETPGPPLVPQLACLGRQLLCLPLDWLSQIVYDYIFYAVCIVCIWTVGRATLDKVQDDQTLRLHASLRNLFVWSWSVMLSYMAMQRSRFLRQFSITEESQLRVLKEKYKLPDSERALAENLALNDIILNVLRNQVVYFGLLWLGFSQYYDGDFGLPGAGLPEVLASVLFCMVQFDVLTYLGHRLLHHRWFYRYHKDHHATRGTLPCSGWYMHIVDMVFQLLIPMQLVPFAIKMNWLAFWTWLVLVEWDGIHSHAGFDFWPGVIPGPTRHFLHHVPPFRWNYSQGLMDYLFDTEKQCDGPRMEKNADHASSTRDASRTVGMRRKQQ